MDTLSIFRLNCSTAVLHCKESLYRNKEIFSRIISRNKETGRFICVTDPVRNKGSIRAINSLIRFITASTLNLSLPFGILSA